MVYTLRGHSHSDALGFNINVNVSTCYAGGAGDGVNCSAALAWSTRLTLCHAVLHIITNIK